MMRGSLPAALLAALLATGIAVPAQAETASTPTFVTGRMPDLSQGRPVAGQGQFSPAPRPNGEIAPPRSRAGDTVRVEPSLGRTGTGQAFRGDGFAPGSAYAGTLERRGGGGFGSTVVPSLNLRVPVQVDLR